MSPGWIIGLILGVLLIGSFWLTFRLIGTVGQHASRERFDWSEKARPFFNRGRPDRLDQLVSQYFLPDKALEQLQTTDRLIARADAILRPA